MYIAFISFELNRYLHLKEHALSGGSGLGEENGSKYHKRTILQSSQLKEISLNGSFYPC